METTHERENEHQQHDEARKQMQMKDKLLEAADQYFDPNCMACWDTSFP